MLASPVVEVYASLHVVTLLYLACDREELSVGRPFCAVQSHVRVDLNEIGI